MVSGYVDNPCTVANHMDYFLDNFKMSSRKVSFGKIPDINKITINNQ
jgi:hypothetical protein